MLWVQQPADPDGGGMGADVVGRVELGPSGCVLLYDSMSDVAYPVVWPAGTNLVSVEPLAIELEDGDRVTIGDHVSGGGGYLKPEEVAVDIPPECLPPTREVAVYNPSTALDQPTP